MPGLFDRGHTLSAFVVLNQFESTLRKHYLQHGRLKYDFHPAPGGVRLQEHLFRRWREASPAIRLAGQSHHPSLRCKDCNTDCAGQNWIEIEGATCLCCQVLNSRLE